MQEAIENEFITFIVEIVLALLYVCYCVYEDKNK